MNGKVMSALCGFVLLFSVVGSAFAGPPAAPAPLVRLPYAVGNTSIDPDWVLNEVGWVLNVCTEPVHTMARLYQYDSTRPLFTEERTLASWEKWPFSLRDLLVEAGFPSGVPDEIEVYLDFVAASGQKCLSVAHSFSVDANAISGTSLFAPNGVCDGSCPVRGVNYINFAGYHGYLVLHHPVLFLKQNVFEVVVRDDAGNLVTQFELPDLPFASTIPFADLPLPEGLRSGTFEVTCPTPACYVGTEFFSTEVDETTGRYLQREEVPGWAVCLPRPPTISQPRCVGLSISISSGSTQGLVGEYFQTVFKVDGSDVRTPGEKDINLLSGLMFEVLDPVHHIYMVFGTPLSTGSGSVDFDNGCTAESFKFHITEEPPPPCEEINIVLDSGSPDGEVGEPFSYVFRVHGSRPIQHSGSDNLLVGLGFTEVERTDDYIKYSVNGTPTQSGDREVLFENECSSSPVTITVTEQPPPECEVPRIETVSGSATWEIGVSSTLLLYVHGTPSFEVFKNFPAGLDYVKMDEHTFQIGGTPSELGDGTFRVENDCGEDSITIHVVEQPPPPCEDIVGSVISGSTTGTVGEPFEFVVGLTAGTEPFSNSVTLVNGLLLDVINPPPDSYKAAYKISGTPTVAGPGLLAVSNSCDEVVFNYTINEPPCVDTTLELVGGSPTGKKGEPFSVTYEAHGTGPFTFDQTDIPTGLTVSQDGNLFTVSGDNPTGVGTGTVTVSGSGDCESASFTVTIEEPPPPQCSECLGKVTTLTLRYLGADAAQVRVRAKHSSSFVTAFDGTVSGGGIFIVTGPTTNNPAFSGTLGTEIRIYVNDVVHTTIHTSCSQPIGPGLQSGAFLVLAGESSEGGELCPLCQETPSWNIDGLVTANDLHNKSNSTSYQTKAEISWSSSTFSGQVQLFWVNGSSSRVKKSADINLGCGLPQDGVLKWPTHTYGYSTSESHHPDRGAEYFARVVANGIVLYEVGPLPVTYF